MQALCGLQGVFLLFNCQTPVYTIIFYEKSPAEFAAAPDCCIHRSGQVLDSGVQMNLLQKYIFINLDIYFKIHQNPVFDS